MQILSVIYNKKYFKLNLIKMIEWNIYIYIWRVSERYVSMRVSVQSSVYVFVCKLSQSFHTSVHVNLFNLNFITLTQYLFQLIATFFSHIPHFTFFFAISLWKDKWCCRITHTLWFFFSYNPLIWNVWIWLNTVVAEHSSLSSHKKLGSSHIET